METTDLDFVSLEIRDDGWVGLWNFVVPQGFTERKKALRLFHKFEESLTGRGLKGWIGNCNIDDYGMIKFLDGLGAKEYFNDGENLVFYKEINGAKIKNTVPDTNDIKP